MGIDQAKNFHIGALVAGSLLILAGCGGGGGSGDSANNQSTGQISIAITDAPVDDAAAVVVAMTEFEFKPVGDEPSFRVPVDGAPRQLNLIEFTDGMAAVIIDGEEVPAGDYAWMRIFFDNELSYVQLEADGTTYPLVIPSGGQTGYKLVSGFTVPANDSVMYVLDFNVRKSLIEPPGLSGPMGSPRTFLLKPVVRIMNVDDIGSVSGVVSSELIDINNARCLDADPDPLTGNAVYVFEGMDAVVDDVADEETDGVPGPFTSDVVDLNIETGEYEYHLMYLLPGTYTLAFTCSASADGADDTDYNLGPGAGGFDFDATINVDIVSDIDKNCAIPAADGQLDPC